MRLDHPLLGAGALAALALAASGQTREIKPAAPPVHKLPAAAPPLAPEESIDASAPKRSAVPLAARFDPFAKGILYSEGGDGLWAAAHRFKARFGTDGATFVPFFGSRSARSSPLGLRTASIELGGHALASAGAGVSRSKDRVSIERGAVDEAWDLGEQGAEQLFVIQEKLAPGELVLRVAYDGEYEASADAEGILFTSAMGSVRYGRATAVDARGRAVEVAETLEAGAIRLTVPADFLATAAYPVTVDPLVIAYTIDGGIADTFAPDVAFEDASSWYLYVYELTFSQTDHDLYSVLGTDSGIVIQTATAIDTSIVDWRDPRVASNLDALSFLVVAETGAPGSRSVRGRLVDAITGDPGPEILLGTGEIGEQLHPDVGGDPNGGPGSAYCVVWERVWNAVDHDVHARLVNPLSGELSQILYVDNTADTLDEAPAIANSCRLDHDGPPCWTIVWQRAFSPTDHDVYGAQLELSGAFRTLPYPIDVSIQDDYAPSVSPILDGAGPNRPYAVAWERAFSATNRDVFVTACIADQILAHVDLSSGQPLSGNDDRRPQVETDGHLFAVAFTKTTGPGASDVWINWVYLADATLSRIGAHEDAAPTLQPEDHAALVSKHSGGNHTSRFALALDADYGNESDVLALVFDAPSEVPVRSFCGGNSFCPCGNNGSSGGCANSASAMGSELTHAGHPNVSHDDLVLTADSLPHGGVCLFIQGNLLLNDGVGVPFGDGLRCVGGGVKRIATVPPSTGTAAYPPAGAPAISVRGAIPATGGRRYYQAWYRDPSNFCTSDTFNFTNVLEVTWLP